MWSICDLIIGNVKGVHEFIDTSPQLPVESTISEIACVPIEKPDAQSTEESTIRVGDLKLSQKLARKLAQTMAGQRSAV